MEETNKVRERWLVVVSILSCYIPNIILSKDLEVRQAFREKYTLCKIMFLMSCFYIFLVAGLPMIFCSRNSEYYTWDRINKQKDESWVIHKGIIYDVKDFITKHPLNKYEFNNFLGKDVSYLFKNKDYKFNKTNGTVELYNDIYINIERYNLYNEFYNNVTVWNNYGNENENKYEQTGIVTIKYNKYEEVLNDNYCLQKVNEITNELEGNYCHEYTENLTLPIIGKLKLDIFELKENNNIQFIILNDRIYNMTDYLYYGFEYKLSSWNIQANIGHYPPLFYPKKNAKYIEIEYFNTLLEEYINDNGTDFFQEYYPNKEHQDNILNFLDKHFLIGYVDDSFEPICIVLENFYLGTVILALSIILIKSISAFGVLKPQFPEDMDKHIIITVPCYSEDADSIERTLRSIMHVKYPSNKKLYFVVADGLITGKGNKYSTAEYVLNIFGRNMDDEETYYHYKSLGTGFKEDNYAKVYTGIWNETPYVIVLKCGNSDEKSRKGNRGKRDSQMVIMKFLNEIFYNRDGDELMETIKTRLRDLGFEPKCYEYLMSIDSDTMVYDDSINHMVHKMEKERNIVALCGETRISNKMDSWVTAIQVYEYFINHNLNKAFESVFKSVTCLPGCFSLFRIKSNPIGQYNPKPYLVDDRILEQYFVTKVDTLHTKSLLHLGEDRYLTLLTLKTFPKKSIEYIIDAKCETVVPNDFSTLLSQRRRWINSTIHNLFELVNIKSLRGCLCFSIRFSIIIDLLSTVFLPIMTMYFFYLIYVFASGMEEFPIFLIIMLSIVYGLQILIFGVKRKFMYFVWLIIYMISTPIWNIIIILYSVWNFDNFDWGKTRELSELTQQEAGAQQQITPPEHVLIMNESFEREIDTIK